MSSKRESDNEYHHEQLLREADERAKEAKDHAEKERKGEAGSSMVMWDTTGDFKVHTDKVLSSHVTCASRYVFTLSPTYLVRIGPDIRKALQSLTSELVLSVENKVLQHFATAYSLARITIILDCFDPKEDSQTRLTRLKFRQNKPIRAQFVNRALSQRVADQIKNIRTNQPNIELPFMCVEDWQGYGPKDHPIFENMVAASDSLENWQKFKASFEVAITSTSTVIN